MAKYIDIEKEIAEMQQVVAHYKDNKTFEAEITSFAFQAIIDKLKQIPAADVTPVVHAEWIEDVYQDEPYVCSNCRWAERDDIHRITGGYCPCCGAKMDEDT